MITPLFPPEFTEQTIVPVGMLGESIHTYQSDLQTGLVQLSYPDYPTLTLLFVRGQLVTVYRDMPKEVERLAPLNWLDSIDGSSQRTALRTLALTPQDVRVFKILIEQQNDANCFVMGGSGFEPKLANWLDHPSAALGQVCWPNAEALVLFPGLGVHPNYSLIMKERQILHSSSGLSEIINWNEPIKSLGYFGSEALTPAWKEYLLHNSFSFLVINLMGKYEKLIGRLQLNQIVKDVNFKATAHDWNLSIHINSVNDQCVFSSPESAAEVYSRLLEVVITQLRSMLGPAILEMLLKDMTGQLSLPARRVVDEYFLLLKI